MFHTIRPARTGFPAAFLFASALLCSSRTALAGINRWTSNGPWGGGITAIVADPSNPQIVYAASQTGGIFRTRDGGNTWQPINNGILDLWIIDLAVDPAAPSTVYAASHTFFVYKSTDAGDHWISQYVNDPTSASGEAASIAVDPTASSTVYAATLAGVWKSDDGGCSWSPSNGGLPTNGQIEANVIAIDPSDGANVYMGTFSDGIYRSGDAGASWTKVLALPFDEQANRIAVDPSDPAVVYAATSYFVDPTGETGGSVYESVDGGTSWSPIASLPNEPFSDVAIDASSMAIYVTSEVGGVRESFDGTTWTPINNGLPGQAAGHLAIGPQPNTLWVASGGAGIFKTADAGAHWSDANTGIAAQLNSSLLVDPDDDSIVWSTNSWGDGASVLRSVDAGQNWARASSGLGLNRGGPLTAMAGSPLTVFVGALDGRVIYKSTDLGDTWAPTTSLPAGSTPGAYGLVVPGTEPARIYAVAGPLFYSDDSGETWTSASPDNHFVYAFTPDAEVAGSSLASVDGILQRSTDHGTTWTPSDSGIETATIQVIVQDPSNPDHLLAGAQGDAVNMIAPISVSNDRGVTWAPSADGIPSGYGVISIVFDPSSALTVYASGYVVAGARAVYRSLDGGATWSAYDRGLGTRGDSAVLAISSDGSTIHMSGLAGVFEIQPSSTPPPSIAGVHPTSGPASGGSLVIVSGAGLASTTSLGFGQVPAGAFKVVDDSHVAAITPPGLPGSASATVTTGEPQDDTLDRAFVYDFGDVPASSPFHEAVVAMTLRAVTGGCGSGNFCPSSPLNRGQAAVQIEKALRGADYSFDPVYGGPGNTLSMADVDRCSGFGPYIQQFLFDGITVGCGYPNYCPLSPVTRAQMMVFLLRGEHGSGYLPPPATGTVFGDVPADAFAADYIEAAAQEGLTAGCGGGNFCPDSPVTRGQAASLILKTFPAAP